MTRIVLDVPNWRLKLLEHLEILAQLSEGLEPGLHYLVIEHEKFCAEALGSGICNCVASFRLEKYVKQAK